MKSVFVVKVVESRFAYVGLRNDSVHLTRADAENYVREWEQQREFLIERLDQVMALFNDWEMDNREPSMMDGPQPQDRGQASYPDEWENWCFKHEINKAVYNDAMDNWRWDWYKEYRAFFKRNPQWGDPKPEDHPEVDRNDDHIPHFDFEIEELFFTRKPREDLINPNW